MQICIKMYTCFKVAMWGLTKGWISIGRNIKAVKTLDNEGSVFWNCAFWVSCSILKIDRYRTSICLVLYRIIVTILCYQIYKNYGTHRIKSHFKNENGSTTLTITIMPLFCLFKFLCHFPLSISLYVLDTFKLRKDSSVLSLIMNYWLVGSQNIPFFFFPTEV